MWGLGFASQLLGPLLDPKNWALVCIVAIGAGLWGHHKGYSGAKSECQSAQLEAALEQSRLQYRALEQQMALARDAEEFLKKAYEQNLLRIEEYKNELAKEPPAPNCAFDQRDVDRLRAIR